VCVTAGYVVLLRIADHESEISLESKSVLVHSCIEFRTHSAEIHRVFDHFEVTGRMNVNENKSMTKCEQQTWARDVVRDPQALRTAWHGHEA
jgi:hypothetical protein